MNLQQGKGGKNFTQDYIVKTGQHWLIFYVDDATKGTHGPAGIGEVLRNNDRQPMVPRIRIFQNRRIMSYHIRYFILCVKSVPVIFKAGWGQAI